MDKSNSETIRLSQASVKDIGWIVDVESRARADGFLRGDDPQTHQDRMNEPTNRYLLINSDSVNIGFAILCSLGSIDRNIELKRIIIARPDKGVGQQVLRKLIDHAFEQLDANRLWLDVLDDNSRARHVYGKCGFREEGCMRQSLWLNGEFRDLIVLSILAEERQI